MIDVRAHGEEHHLSLEEFETRVRAGRIGEDAEIRFEPVTGEDWVRAGDLELYRDLAEDPIRRTATRLPDHAPPILTALLIGVNIRVWWLGGALDFGNSTSRLLTNWTAPILVDGESWRLWTMGFAHTAPSHIFSNLVWFTLASALLERVLGRANLLVLYLGSVLAGALASAYFAPFTPSLGASGGVFGLIGALMVFGMRHGDLLTRRQRQFFGWAMVPYLVFMLWSGTRSSGTDNWAHFFGFFAGVGLCFALSPRDPAHNQRVRKAVWAVSGVIAILPMLFGPRLYPMMDSVQASRIALSLQRPDMPFPEPEPDILAFEVPAGWRRDGGPTGATGFVSPALRRGQTLGVAVSDAEGDVFLDNQALYDQLGERLHRAWPELVLPAAEPSSLAGLPALTARIELDEDTVVHWTGVARGVQSLEATWWVDPTREARMEPLRERVWSSVSWEEPPELLDARRAVEETPSPSSRRRLAWQLARIGQASESVALLDQVLSDPLASAEARALAWITRLDVAEATGEPLDLDRPLADGTPEVVLAVADQLVDEPTVRRGLLDIAGGRWPADKALRKARLREDLPARRDKETGAPWHLAFHPDGSPRAEREDLLARPLTLAAAADAGAWLDEVDAQAVALALEVPAKRLDALAFLKFRYLPDDREAARESLSKDLARAADGRAPRWMPTAIVAAAADPAFAEPIATP
ncbi:MAG: rhomboid family intramembrane serine protease [Deltaproteobacteria bacterium]|nr:MAG: rhomboid family intramembrane serine protease [Deltaproteobacteria bacterium]